MTSGKQTPKKLAKDWVKQNPNRSNVRIDVLTLVPRGRNGRCGLGQRTTTFYAHNGSLKKLEELDGNPLELVIIDLQHEPWEVVEVETSNCFYYRDDDEVMTVWQRISGENKRLSPNKVYQLLP